jgi:hypothetical protein
VKFARASSKNRGQLTRVTKAVAQTRERLSSNMTPSAAGVIDAELKEQLDKIERAVRAGANPKEAADLVTQIREIREDIGELPSQPEVGAVAEVAPSNDLLDVVRQVLIERLGQTTADEIMALVHERIAKVRSLLG